MALKMVLVVRKDLGMRKGKIAAQAAHAAQEAILDRSADTPVLKSDPVILEWLADDYRKITVSVNSEAELLAVHQAALDAGLNTHLVQDHGHTEFHGVLTYTVVALGPAEAEVVDAISGDLPLL